jgi:predicted nucleic acid-binding protein
VIFVDTSVWIDYFNGNDTAATDRLDTALQDEAVVIGDLVLLEIPP